MRDLGEPMTAGQLLFKGVGKTSLHFDDRLAAGAHQMMMMVVAGIGREFPTRGAVADVHPLDQTHFEQCVDVAINRGEIAIVCEQTVDFAVRQRRRMLAKDIQNGLSWPGDLSIHRPEPYGEIIQRGLNETMHMTVFCAGTRHGRNSKGWPKGRLAWDPDAIGAEGMM